MLDLTIDAWKQPVNQVRQLIKQQTKLLDFSSVPSQT
jgi:hypothetical protein